MKIGIGTLLSCLTKSGRQKFTRELLNEYASPEAIQKYATDGVAVALDKGTAYMTEERTKQIARGCELGGALFNSVGKAINPDSESGTKVSEGEKQVILRDVSDITGIFLTQDFINGFIDKIVEKVP